MRNRLTAILSSTVLVKDGIYKIETLEEIPDIKGVMHYIGHPSTRSIVEKLGAVKASSNLFQGLEINQSAICFTLKMEKNTREKEGITLNQETSIDDLQIRLLTRIK